MATKKIRQSDIAEKLNITRTTVARAFSGENISAKTRERVLAAAKEMGYVHNGAAATLAMKKCKVVYAFIVGTIDEGYSDMIIKGMQDAVKLWSGYNFQIKVFVTDIKLRGNKCHEQIDQFYEVVGNERPDGVVFSALGQENMDLVTAYCRENEIPLMTLDAVSKNAELCHVGPDCYEFGEATAAYLASLIKRQGKILAISYDDGYEWSSLRMKGFFRWLRQNCPEIEVLNVEADNISRSTYKRILKEYLETFQPDAIYAPFKMDYIVQILQEMEQERRYILISNGINADIEKYLYSGIIAGIISSCPYQLGAIIANNFFKYFFRSTEVVKNEIDIGFDIYIKESYRKAAQMRI